MRRADRLFQIIQLLRRRHVVTASFLARGRLTLVGYNGANFVMRIVQQ